MRRIIFAPSPFDRQREHLAQEREHAVRVVLRLLQRAVQQFDVATAYSLNSQASKARQNDAVQLLAIVANTTGPLVLQGMLFDVGMGKLGHQRLGSVARS